MYKIILQLRKIYWFICRPKTQGVKVVIECKDEILMIKNTYGKNVWTFPGGGIEKDEDPITAAKREVKEEVGIIISDLRDVGKLSNEREYKRDTIYCFQALVDTKLVSTNLNEIKEAFWFNKNHLPSDMSSISMQIYENYEKQGL
mgnify:CR=1 FL=1